MIRKFLVITILFSSVVNIGICRRIRVSIDYLILHRVQDKDVQEVAYPIVELDVRQYGSQLYISHDEITQANGLMTLSDALEKWKDVVIQIDVKCDESVGISVTDPTLLYYELEKADVLDRVIVSSWDLKFLEDLRQMDKNIKLGYDPSLEPLPQNLEETVAFCDYLLDIAEDLGLHMISIRNSLADLIIANGLTSEFVNRAREVGCFIAVWTVNDVEGVKKYLSYGFFVTTDLQKGGNDED